VSQNRSNEREVEENLLTHGASKTNRGGIDQGGRGGYLVYSVEHKHAVGTETRGGPRGEGEECTCEPESFSYNSNMCAQRPYQKEERGWFLNYLLKVKERGDVFISRDVMERKVRHKEDIKREPIVTLLRWKEKERGWGGTFLSPTIQSKRRVGSTGEKAEVGKGPRLDHERD